MQISLKRFKREENKRLTAKFIVVLCKPHLNVSLSLTHDVSNNPFAIIVDILSEQLEFVWNKPANTGSP